jgi:hypothetical protein
MATLDQEFFRGLLSPDALREAWLKDHLVRDLAAVVRGQIPLDESVLQMGLTDLPPNDTGITGKTFTDDSMGRLAELVDDFVIGQKEERDTYTRVDDLDRRVLNARQSCYATCFIVEFGMRGKQRPMIEEIAMQLFPLAEVPFNPKT